jgi:hypothetical protein
MIKYINNKHFLRVASLLILLIGCDEDLLEPTPFAQSTSASFWRNADDAIAAANAMYTPLTSFGMYSHGENVFDNSSDDLYRAGDHGDEGALENFTMDASNSESSAGWKPKYEIINRANSILINLPNIEGMDAGLQSRILGEAHFLRAFTYWRLAVIYGGVPLILEQNVIDAEFNVAKSSLTEVQSQIESDLITAIGLLPDTHKTEDLGRPNKGSANGLLAKLYLYQDNLSGTITAGQKVINGPYPLASNYRDNYEPATENNPEVLFAVQGEENWQPLYHYYFTPPRPWGGWDFHNPTQDMVEEYEEGDIRLESSIWKPGDLVDRGAKGVTEFTQDLSATGYSLNKFADFKDDGNTNGDINVNVLRAADVYLLVAEAKIRKDGAGSGDAEINEVRARAGLPPVSNAGMPELIHERRVELFGENQRHQDLMRWDRAGIVDIVQIYGEDRGQFDPPRVFVRPKHYYFPIPQSEIDISNGVLIQNEGY